MKYPSSLMVIGVCAAGVLPAGRAGADQFSTTRGQPIVETEHAVNVSVEDGLATLKVRRVFENRGSEADQVEMMIELPYDTVATGMRIKAGKKWYDAELREARMAAIVYERLTGHGPWRARDPALLAWGDLGVLDLWVFPVFAGSENVIEYTLIQPVDYRDGTWFMTYPDVVTDASLAEVTMSIKTSHKAAAISINGRKVGAGKMAKIGKRLAGEDELDSYVPPGGYLCDDYYDEDERPPCREPGHAMITMTAPPTDTLEARYGTFDLGGGMSVVRLEIDTAKILRPAPKKASVVFVLDASRSWGRENIEAALAFCSAYVKELPDARYEVVLFRRDAERLLGDFTAAAEWKQELAAATGDPAALEPGNGSNVEKGLELAASILQGSKGPLRVILVSDALYRMNYANAGAIKALSALPDGAVVHAVDLEWGPGDVYADRNDFHDIAAVPLARGGILLDLGGGGKAADFKDAARLLVRPRQIDEFKVVHNGADLCDHGDVPETLEEGVGLRVMFVSDEPLPSVTIRGKIWASPFMQVVAADPDLSENIVPALVFAGDLYLELDEDQMMRAATAGGAVSPLTSYLSVEPGVRPSTIGLEEEEGMGGGGAVGFGGGGASVSCGMGGSAKIQPDHGPALRKLLVDAAAPCFFGEDGKSAVGVRIESTYREVVDVDADSDRASLKSCVAEAAWTIELTDEFKERSYSRTVTLP
ncbi:MAG: vWA domain-containing protein [Pseudomonadota bacterium]